MRPAIHLVFPPAAQVALRHDAPPEGRDLVAREGRPGEVVVQVERAEQVRDVVHALIELRPVARAAVVGRGRNGLEPSEELPEVGVERLGKHIRVRLGQVRAERQHSAG